MQIRVGFDTATLGTIRATDEGTLAFAGKKAALQKLVEYYVEQMADDMDLPEEDVTAEAVLTHMVERMTGRSWAEEVDTEEAVANADAPGFGPPLVPLNPRWRFLNTPEKAQAFRRWLSGQVSELERELEAIVTRFTREGFAKGLARAFADVKPPPPVLPVANVRRNDLDFYAGTREEFLRSSFGRPASAEKVALLASRTFTDLQGVTAQMSAQMSRVLTDGLTTGKGPREIARELSKKVEGIGQKRALTIARTEIISAHAEGQLEALEELGVEEVGVMVEWLVTDDERLCERCADMTGKTFPLAEAKGMIPLHPNCRCAWIPAGVGEKDAKKAGKAKSQARRSVEVKQTKEPAPRRQPALPLKEEDVVESLRSTAVNMPVPVQLHSMPAPEAMREVAHKGMTIQYAPGAEEAALVSAKKIAEAKVPEKLRQAGEKVVFTTQRNKDDAYWEQVFKMPGFKAIATGGDGQIVVYNGGRLAVGSYAHEAGHNVAAKIWGSVNPADSSKYMRAWSVEKAVSAYGANSSAEDFAEACRMFVTDRETLRRKFPLKFAAVKELLE